MENKFNTIENLDFNFSSVLDVEGDEKNISLGSKCIKLINKNNNQEVGVVQFDLPSNSDIEKLIANKFIAVKFDYKGQDLGTRLFERLLSESKNLGLNGIKTGSFVELNAVASIYKLSKEGYTVIVHDEVKDLYRKFKKDYDEKKNFEGKFSVSKMEDSVFKILAKKDPQLQ